MEQVAFTAFSLMTFGGRVECIAFAFLFEMQDLKLSINAGYDR